MTPLRPLPFRDITPLMRAAMKNDLDTLHRLLSPRQRDSAQIDARDQGGRTALVHALLAGQEEAALLLIHHGADATLPLSKDGRTPLMIACAAGYDGVIERLITKSIPLDTRQTNKTGRTALMIAVAQGHVWIACRLVRAGADETLTEGDSRTSAHSLAYSCFTPTGRDFFEAALARRAEEHRQADACEKAKLRRACTALRTDMPPMQLRRAGQPRLGPQ